MNGKMLGAVALAGITAGLGLAAPASAQTGNMARTWVSGAGLDGNACTRLSPCQTLTGALAKTAVGGEITCVDAGGSFSATITGSVSIICDNTEANVLAATANTSGIVINGANAVVTISGLDLDGFNIGTNGIQVTNAASVTLTNVKIRNFVGYGIRFEPSAAASLTVKKADISNNGTTGTVSGGIYVRPTAAVAGNVVVSNTLIANNRNAGFRADPMSGSAVNVVIENTISSNNGVGLLFRAGAIGSVTGSTLVYNTAAGLNSNGASTTVADTTITANAVGVNGNVVTFGNNRLFGNTTNGAFTGSQPTQ